MVVLKPQHDPFRLTDPLNSIEQHFRQAPRAMAKVPNIGGSRPRLGLAGCGYWGRNLLRNFHSLGALVAVCDADSRRAAHEAENYGLPALTFEELLAAPDIDAVVLATPAETHAALALRVIEA